MHCCGSTPWIGLLGLLLACQTPGADRQTGIGGGPGETAIHADACPEREFRKQYAPEWVVRGRYLACAPDWNYNLVFLLDNRPVYRTDSLQEYEFGEYPFPTLIRAEGITYVLVERNDRPLASKMDVFGFRAGVLDTLFTIPLFEKSAKDLDHDGEAEYYGPMEALESVKTGWIGYNPILAYKITGHSIACDTTATILVNKQVYGDFYGWKADDKQQFNEKAVEKNWP